MVDYDEDDIVPIWYTPRYNFAGEFVSGHDYSPVICDLDSNGYPDILTSRSVRWGPPDYDQYGRHLVVYDGRFGTEIMYWTCPEAIIKGWMSAGDMNGDNCLDFTLIEENKIKIYTFYTVIPHEPEARPWLHPMKNVRNHMCTGDDD
jgi:hypothetical protein